MLKRVKTMLLPLVLLAAVLGGMPADARTLPQTHVGGYPLFAALSCPTQPSQVPESQQASALSWYDTASECSDAAENPGLRFTFRGDTRPPSEIFHQGFTARGKSTDLLAHTLDNRSPPSAFIPTSKSGEVAAEFADNVYVVRPRGGIDVNAALGPRSPFPNEFEVAIPWRIDSSDIRAVTLPKEGLSILNPYWVP